MDLQKNIKDQQRLKRLGHQLLLSEKLLQKHPLVQQKLTVLQTTLHDFNLHMQWALAGPTARLLITFRSALYAQETNKSQTGFIGPALQRLQQVVAQFMHLSLSASEKEFTSLLATFAQVIAWGTLYLATQLLENWKRMFPQHDPLAAKKAGLLLRELGLTFVLGSHATESAFYSIGQGLGLKESSQKRVADIGRCFLLVLFILIDEDDPHEEEFIDTVKRVMQPTLDSVEYALRQAQAEHVFEDQDASLAFTQLLLIRQALDTLEGQTLKQVLANSFDTLGLPWQDVKHDVKKLMEFCSQLNESFKNIFYQTSMTATTVIQSA